MIKFKMGELKNFEVLIYVIRRLSEQYVRVDMREELLSISLKVQERIEYKIISTTYKVLQSSSPHYLRDIITIQPSRSTRSSSLVTLLLVKRTDCSRWGHWKSLLNRDKLSDKKNTTDEDILRLFMVKKIFLYAINFSLINRVYHKWISKKKKPKNLSLRNKCLKYKTLLNNKPSLH